MGKPIDKTKLLSEITTVLGVDLKVKELQTLEDKPLKLPLDYDRFLKDMCYDKEDLASKLINMLVILIFLSIFMRTSEVSY